MLTSTPSKSVTENQTEQPLNGATPNDISEALTINAHYKQVNEQKQQAPVFDDVWERIRYQLSIEVPQNVP